MSARQAGLIHIGSFGLENCRRHQSSSCALREWMVFQSLFGAGYCNRYTPQ
jgi:hypothetical protein